MRGFEMVYVLVMIFAVRILLPIGVVAGLGSLLKKLQPSR